MSLTDRVMGPQVPDEELQSHRARYRRPPLFFAGAAVLLLLSLLVPYWVLDLKAPQFPQGLRVSAYLNRLVGDVDPATGTNDLHQLESLNFYIGMRSLDDGARFERAIAVPAVLIMAGLLFAASFVRTRWAALVALPALVFPVVFIADLQYWLWNYGHSLDPGAPLSGAVGEFTPPVFGHSTIAQFETNARPGLGLVLAFGASLLVALGLWFHRRAYRPLALSLDDTASDMAGATAEG